MKTYHERNHNLFINTIHLFHRFLTYDLFTPVYTCARAEFSLGILFEWEDQPDHWENGCWILRYEITEEDYEHK